MKKKVACLEFPVFQGIAPLASAYLQSAACLVSGIEETFEFEKHSFPVSSAGIVEEVDRIDADVYTFSCYVWNMGLVRRLLPPLLARKPDAHIILGGPQAMHHAERYLMPEHENLVLCNGEGEYPFAEYLTQLMASDPPDLTPVKGLSFYRNGELITTPQNDRIVDLDAIPSPYLTGLIDVTKYVWAAMETNRGCPFKCTYCYWGAATNSKVRKYEGDRILDEFTRLSEQGILYIFIADANFGMLNRDLEIARHIAECKKKYGYPLTVYFSSSKNTPDRVTEITKLFAEAGLVATQPISLQTMSADTLESVKRSNIKTSSYTALQEVLNEHSLSSFIEMIWPLPGETLESFKTGIGELCSRGANSFSVYPLLLINNVEMNQQREEYELQVIDDPDPNSEAQVVVGSKDVSYEDYLEGLRFSFHVTILYSARALRYVGRYLDTSGRLLLGDLLVKFSDFYHQSAPNPYKDFIEDMLATSQQYKFSSIGGILHTVLHAHREEFDRLLVEFMESLGDWADPKVRLLLELDLLNRPYVYRNTPIVGQSSQLELIRIESVHRDGYVVRMLEDHYEQVAESLGFVDRGGAPVLKVKYRSTQLPYMKAKSLDDNYSYCKDKLHMMESILPAWSAL